MSKKKKKPNKIKHIYLLLSVVIILIIVSFFFYSFFSKESSAWYSTSWLYRNEIEVGNSTGSTLINEDVLVQIDTQTLITAGKMQSDCDDIRFLETDNVTTLSYWIEDGCNTSSTQIWVRIPSIPNGGKSIYVYYGNSSPSSTGLTWDGSPMLYSDSTCPAGWSQVSLEDKFLYGGSDFGSSSGSKIYTHSGITATSDTTISPSSPVGLISGILNGAPRNHQHQLYASMSYPTYTLPPYLDLILCSANSSSFNIASGLISGFNSVTPVNWTRFSTLDGKFPRVALSYGETGGSGGHTHTFNTGATTSPNQSLVKLFTPIQATGGTVTYSGTDKIHTFTSDGTLSVSTGGTAQVLAVGGGGPGGPDCGGGGGGGGYVYTSSFSLSTGNISVDIGGSYQSTYFSSITATRGGLGGALENNGGAGGSGGGAGGWWTTSGTRIGGTGSQGYNGGNSGQYLAGGGGGGGGQIGQTAPGWKDAGDGGNGYTSSISGASVTYSGGGGGGSGLTAGLGGTGGGGDGGVKEVGTGLGENGTNGRGGGGGGGGSARNGGSGGSGILIIRYSYPPADGSIATSSHTHQTNSLSITSTTTTLPPFINILYAKSNINGLYPDSSYILITDVLPPMGWSIFTDLNDRFGRGASSFGDIGGATSHTHSVTLYTDTPSSTTSYYGTSGLDLASSSHYHSADATSSPASNIPPDYSVLFIQRKTSQTTTLQTEESLNAQPNAPSSLLAEGVSTPLKVTDTTPEFSAVFSDSDTGDTGVSYQINVNTQSDFLGTSMWDSGKQSITTITNGARSSDIAYGVVGTPVTLSLNGNTYYWRIKFWDNGDLASPWSSTSSFTMDGNPFAPSNLTTDNMTNPSFIASIYPKFSALHTDPNTDSANYYEIDVNSNNLFTGTVMWASGKSSMTSTTSGNRCPDITYAGTALTGSSGTTYYWRIRFWDTDSNVSEWSTTGSFVDSMNHQYFNGLQMSGIRLD